MALPDTKDMGEGDGMPTLWVNHTLIKLMSMNLIKSV